MNIFVVTQVLCPLVRGFFVSNVRKYGVRVRPLESPLDGSKTNPKACVEEICPNSRRWGFSLYALECNNIAETIPPERAKCQHQEKIRVIHGKHTYSIGKLIRILSNIEMDDNYEHPDDSVEYILENAPFHPSPNHSSDLDECESLQELFNSVYSVNCNCTGQLCNTKHLCSHGGNYMPSANTNGHKELILNESRPCKDLIYECCENCGCPATCHNRLVQYGPRKNLQIIDVVYSDVGQKGLITTKCIPKGAFICEYAGEILTKSEANYRYMRNKKEKCMNYILCLNESSTESDQEKLQTFVDPSRKGNIGRYLNHSCNPNCMIMSVRVGCPVPRLGIFAKRDISELEELTFHYGGERKEDLLDHADRIPCHCGSVNCAKFLPNFSF